MWLITPIGFFSIVEKPSDKKTGTLTVRARVRDDLLSLKQHYLPGLGPIQESADTDYRFRATAPRAEVPAAMARLVDELDYSNFKSEVAKRQGHKRSSLYHNVWDVLYQLQTDPAFAEKKPSATSFGGVVVSGGNRVLLREPTNHHGGYAWTFAKTEAKSGESPRDAAIRAVREKTGYDVEIRVSVPDLFKGSSSSSAFYVMDAKHPPAKHNWQTANLRWVPFEQARDLIRQSSNTEGLSRDLAILDAAEKAIAQIPYKEHLNVQPEDWSDLRPMPERHTVLYPKLQFTPEEMQKIRRGFFPTVMEQKWFLYFTGTRLRMHRSWSGILIYDVGFAFDSKDGAYVTDVIVNRDRDEYGNADDNEDLALMQKVIRYHLLEPLDEPEIDGMAKAMMLAMQPNYLGSPEVVSTLVKEIFDVVVRTVANEATPQDVADAIAKVVAAFTDDTGYTRMPGWHSAEQMGSYVQKYLSGSADDDEAESLAELLENGMHALIGKLHEMLNGFFKDPAANWDEHALAQLNALHQFVVSVLLGTNTVSYGDKVLQDFTWQPTTTQPHDDKKQIVLRVGSEGGTLALIGIQSGKDWQFRVEGDESTLNDLSDEASLELPQRPWVTTWRSALKQLDAYPWTHLYPLSVHHDFHERVFKALKTREKKGSIDWEQWSSVLNMDIEL